MLNAIEKTSVYTLALCKEIMALMEKVRTTMKNERPKIYSHELLEILFTNVYTRTDHLIQKNIASRNIAGKYLKELESLGILKSEKIGRDVFYINTGLFDLFKNS